MKPIQILIFLVSAAAAFTVLALGRYAFKTQADAEFWNTLSGAGEEVAEMRHKERETLESGPMPIEQAIKAYAVKGRSGFDVLKVQGGQKVAPVAGWVNHPDFDERAAAAKAFSEQGAQQAEAVEAAASSEATPAEAAE